MDNLCRSGRIFLHWARFPFYRVEEEPGGRTRVSIMDARYALRPGRGIGSVMVEVAGGQELGLLSRKQSRELLDETGDVLCHQSPDSLVLDLVVGMDQDIPLIDDQSPGNLRICRFELR